MEQAHYGRSASSEGTVDGVNPVRPSDAGAFLRPTVKGEARHGRKQEPAVEETDLDVEESEAEEEGFVEPLDLQA